MADFFGKAFCRLYTLYGQWSPSKYFVLAFDLLIAVVVFLLIRYRSLYDGFGFHDIAIVVVLFCISFMVVRTYVGLIRHTGFYDIARIIGSCVMCFALYMLLRWGLSSFAPQWLASLPSVAEMLMLTAVVALFIVVLRLVIKFVYFVGKRNGERQKRVVVIYGAGSMGSMTKNVLQSDDTVRFKIPFFVDDDFAKSGKVMDGVPVLSVAEGLSAESVERYNVDTLVLAMPNISADKKRMVIAEGMKLGLNVLSTPAPNTWMSGTFRADQLKNMKIEDLLGREPVLLKREEVRSFLKDQVVLVTGASGSIGQEIVRQVMASEAKKIVSLDQSESSTFDVQFSMSKEYGLTSGSDKLKFVIADVRDEVRMRNVFETFHPTIVFHAAAYKHVPLMEENVYEAVRMNVFGTKLLADLSVEYGVSHFVMISTDKAVNPTNVMGATKRLAEMYVQSFSNVSTSFVTTRFGNVLGSSGSVIPLFRRQIEEGGPVTLTHKDIVRFFMTIPEACSLVLESAVIGETGEIYLFDMGEPVRIYDLAANMIRLSKAYHVEIKEIGLRPGEKLYEEVLSDREKASPTSHPKILRAKISPCDPQTLNVYMRDLKETLDSCDDFAIVAMLKKIVPEFISNNSRFSALDEEAGKSAES